MNVKRNSSGIPAPVMGLYPDPVDENRYPVNGRWRYETH